MLASVDSGVVDDDSEDQFEGLRRGWWRCERDVQVEQRDAK